MMIAMKPGKDGKEWFLCPPCYQDGLHKMNGEPIVAVTATAPVSKPRTKKEPERSSVKAEVGSFERHPNEPESETDEERSRLRWLGGYGTYIPDDDNFW